MMDLPEYVTKQEVRRVCKELGLRDWTKLKKPSITPAEARTIQLAVGTGGLKVDEDQFRAGLEVELEHGVLFPEFNVTNNHPILTGRIVMAHFMESLDYYMRLEVAELEGDLLKAIVKGDAARVRTYARRVAGARQVLVHYEQKVL